METRGETQGHCYSDPGVKRIGTDLFPSADAETKRTVPPFQTLKQKGPVPPFHAHFREVNG